MVAFILVCLVLLLGLLWGWEIRKRKSLEQEFVKKKNEVCSVKEFWVSGFSGLASFLLSV